MTDKLERIQHELSEYEKGMVLIGGCTDGNCVIVRPTGMHTNGGCHCYEREKYTISRALSRASIMYHRINKIISE